MQKILLPFLALALLLVAGCGNDSNNDDNSAKLDVTFRADYAGQPLVMFDETYSYPDNMSLKLQLFQYYISDLALVRANGEIVPLSEIELIKFGDDLTLQDAQNGYKLTFNDIPTGEYSTLRFGLGVNPDLNATQPGNYSPTHPLSDNYWSWALGYVFVKIEGNADTNGDGQFAEKLTYHVGADPLYRVLEFTGPFNVSKDGGAINLGVDLRKVLVRDNQFIDFRIPEDTQDHTNDEVLYRFIWDNLAQAIQVK